MQQAFNECIHPFSVEVFDVPFFGVAQKAEDDGDEQERKQEDHHDVDGGHDAELDQQTTAGKDKGDKAAGGGEVGQKGGVADFPNHALQRLDAVPVQAEFLMVFVEHEHRIGNADDDDQRGNHAGEDGDFVTEQGLTAQGPDNGDADDQHGKQNNFKGAEKEEDDQGGNAQGQENKHVEFALDHFGGFYTDKGEAGIMQPGAVDGVEAGTGRFDAFYKRYTLGTLKDLRHQKHGHEVGVGLGIVE